MKFNRFKTKNFFFLFLICITQISILFFYSRISWFWTDEGNTVKNVLGFSWLRIFQGEVAEGNTSPLYYLILKAVLLCFKGINFNGYEVDIIRLFIGILPTVFFTISVIKQLMNRVSSQRLSIIYAAIFFITVNSTHFFTVHSWQARQYSLWTCFTWFFLLSLNELIRNTENKSRNICLLLLYSLLLVLTMPVSILFVVVGILGLLVFYPADLFNRIKLSLLFIPILIIGTYYVLKVPPQPYQWPGIWASMFPIIAHAKYWLLAPFMFLLLYNKQSINTFYLYIYTLVAFFISTIFIMANLYLRDDPAGYELPNRYFVYLLPVCIFLFLTSLSYFQTKLPSIFISSYFFLIGLIGLTHWVQHFRVVKTDFSRAREVELQIESIQYESGQKACFCMEPISTDIDVDGWGEVLLRFYSINNNCKQFSAVEVHYINGSRVSRLSLSKHKYASITKDQTCNSN